MPDIKSVSTARCVLGEGPVWDQDSGCLFWVDIKAPALHSLELASGTERRWPMPSFLGAIGLSKEPRQFIGAFANGFAAIDADANTVVPIAHPEADRPSNRFNDGKVDSSGRFWAGTMDDREREASGHLYRLNPDFSVQKFELGFVVSNGIDWSNDKRIVYIVSSTERIIFAFDFDDAAGTIGKQRVFARVPDDAGFPDGLTVDANDHVWSAHWGGSRVTRYRPDGTIDKVVPMPVPRCTSCCFGGPGLSTLYVTSARVGLDEAALQRAPLSGALFAISNPGATGRQPGRFAGDLTRFAQRT